MAWAKLDDQFVEHPKIVELGDRAFRLHVAAICLANRKLTDGHISTHDARILMATVRANRRHADELVEHRVWDRNGDGWVIRDYLDWNPDAQTVKERRRKDNERRNRNR